MLKSCGLFMTTFVGWSLLTIGLGMASLGVMSVAGRDAVGATATLPVGNANDTYHKPDCENSTPANPTTSGCAWKLNPGSCVGDCNATTANACAPAAGPPPTKVSCLQVTLPGDPSRSDGWCQTVAGP